MEAGKTWAWLLPSGKICKVMTNPEHGTIKIYDQNRKLVRNDENLSEDGVRIIEENFLEIVATRVGAKEMERAKGTEDDLEIALYIR